MTAHPTEISSGEHPELRRAVAAALRTVVPLASVSADALADDILLRVRQAGWRPDDAVPGDVFVAVTNPLGTPPRGYNEAAHVSVHRSEASAQAALDRWAHENPEFGGYVQFDCLKQRVEE
jgi:hypothetical protein